MLVALDTNILAYAEGVGDAPRCEQAIQLIEQLPVNLVLLPAQTLGELFRVLTGKAKREPGLSRMAIMAWGDAFMIGDSSWSAFQAAMDLVVDHRFQVWDALIMAVAAENHCRILLSEDLQNGFIWRGVTVVNPFASPTSPLLDNVLQSGSHFSDRR
jgi:predicted nucleic acid-binding protein